MHCVLSYNLIEATEDRRKEVEQEVEKILAAYQFAKRLRNFYIIKTKTVEEWDLILKQLSDYSKSIVEKLHFIMSPPVVGGRYNGILVKGEWDFINELSTETNAGKL